MRVYNYGSHGNGTIFVAPGKDQPETSDWIKVGRDASGRDTREPVQFTVKFQRGVAEVPDNIGRYLIDKKLARKSPLILRDSGVATADVPARRPPVAVGRSLDEVLRR
jgi:hypothetical protein